MREKMGEKKLLSTDHTESTDKYKKRGFMFKKMQRILQPRKTQNTNIERQ
jgi:uncharacterized protein (UPF0335 family)